MAEPIVVFMSSDDEYAPFAATTMVSILEHTEASVKFYVADCGISERNKRRLLHIQQSGRCEIEYVVLDMEALFRDCVERTWISKAMYGRYVLPQLAKNEKRAIYTDLDVAFVGDIQQLWDEPLEGRTIGAVPSQRGRINRRYQEYKLTNGLDPEHDVFMSGLLLIDCEKWREEGVTERLLEVSRRELLLDQETMNIVFDHNRYQKLDAKYCVIYKLLNTCFPPEEKEALLRRQVIVHYPGGNEWKPWNNPSLWGGEFFWETAQKTEFYQDILQRGGEQTMEALEKELERHDSVMIYGAGEIGMLTAKTLLSLHCRARVTAFLVSRRSAGSPARLDVCGTEIPVLEAAEAAVDERTLVIAAVSSLWMREIRRNIQELGFRHVVYMTPLLERALRANRFYLAQEVESLTRHVQKLEKEMNGLYALLNTATDITRCRPAAGELAKVQQANILLLDIFHAICRREGIAYWLDWGTLLGAVRHGGFIPWDDDIDVAMMREEYDRMLPLLRRYLEPWGFVISEGRGYLNQVIRIDLEGYPATLDIWPYDFSEVDVGDPDAREDLREKIHLCHKAFFNRYAANYSKGKLKVFPRNRIEEIRLEVLGGCDPSRRRSIHGGIEAITYEEPSIFAVEDVFPLRPIRWEGRETFAPNRAEQYLTVIYGDYMSYPKMKVGGHNNIMRHKNYDFDWEIKLLTDVKLSLESGAAPGKDEGKR